MMDIQLHQEPNNTPSEFLRFEQRLDKFNSMSAEDTKMPRMSYLRIELARIRTGMNDYLLRVSTPRFKGDSKSNTIITLRGNKGLGNLQGCAKIAKTIADQMVKREDSTHAWGALDQDHLAKMLLPSLKFFTSNTSTDTLRFQTEALL